MTKNFDWYSEPYTLGRLDDSVESACDYCLQHPCVTLAADRKPFMMAHGPPRPQNVSKRYKMYREYYRVLKAIGLWRDDRYCTRKTELGIFIDDVREVMPNCVVGDVRKRWPNPPDIPYKGHIPILGQQ